MINLFYELYCYLRRHQLEASNIKITIEFLHPETQARAEYVLKTQALGTVTDPQFIEGMCAGNPWKMFGVNFQVKKFEHKAKEYLPACNCPFCQHMRNEAVRL